MPVKLQTKMRALQRRQQVAELYLQGYSQIQIGERIGAAQPTISMDLKKIREEWRASTVRDFDAARDLELKKLDRIEREAWQAWERSQKPHQSAVIEGDGPGRTKKTVSNSCGDPRFLEVIHKCIAQRRAILGLDPLPPPERIRDVDGLTPDLQRTRVVAVLGGLRSTLARLGEGTGEVQPRLLGAGDKSGEVDAG